MMMQSSGAVRPGDQINPEQLTDDSRIAISNTFVDDTAAPVPAADSGTLIDE